MGDHESDGSKSHKAPNFKKQITNKFWQRHVARPPSAQINSNDRNNMKYASG